MDDLEEVLGAFLFLLRLEIPMSLEDRVCDDITAYCRGKDTVILCDITFLTDISSRLNNFDAKFRKFARKKLRDPVQWPVASSLLKGGWVGS